MLIPKPMKVLYEEREDVVEALSTIIPLSSGLRWKEVLNVLDKFIRLASIGRWNTSTQLQRKDNK
jgi:hypothetical protein